MSVFRRVEPVTREVANQRVADLLGPVTLGFVTALLDRARTLALWSDAPASPTTTPRNAVDLLLVTAPPTSPEADGIVRSLAPHAQVVILDSEDPQYDDVKCRFVELGHVGLERGRSLWLGGVEGHRIGFDESPRAAEPLIVSYFTSGTPYEAEAERLRASCRALDLDHEIVAIDPAGQWEANCAMKAGVVLDAWRRTRRPVLWVDADAVIRARPSLLADTTFDFGVHKVDRWQLASGTIYFGSRDAAGAVLERWEALCRAAPDTWDQVHLDQAWADVSRMGPLRTLWLPQGYTRIFDRAWGPGEDPTVVIEHFQASRRLKAEVSTGTPQPRPVRDTAFKLTRAVSRVMPRVQTDTVAMPRMDLFIAGMSRSGSTMLANLLTTRPARWVLVEPGLTRGDLGEHVRQQSERFGLPVSPEEWSAVPAETPVERFVRCIASRFATAGVRQWGVKEVNPAGWRDLFALADPRRVIVTVRDLRDVAISAIEKQQRSPRAGQDEDWLFDRIASSARAQLDCVDTLDPLRCRVTRYEDFVTAAAERSALVEWLDGWPMDGAPGEGLELFGRAYETERHGQAVTSRSVSRFSSEKDSRRLAFAARVQADLADYQVRFGYA